MKPYRPEPLVGDIWQDCDKRMAGRRCRVVAVNGSKAQLQNIAGPVPPTWVSIRRMYPHSTGWRLVERAGSTSNAVQEAE